MSAKDGHRGSQSRGGRTAASSKRGKSSFAIMLTDNPDRSATESTETTSVKIGPPVESVKMLVAGKGRGSARFHLLVIVLLWCAIYIPGMFSPPLLDDADARHAEAAREMLQRHDFVTMYVDGVRYLDKAPLPYWLNAASHALFGINEFAVRLPMSLAALALLVSVYLLGRDLAGPNAGFFSALVLATAIGPYIYTRFFIPDILVCFWLTLTVHLFLRALEGKAVRVWCWLIGAVTALNVLTKGLIGVVFPALIFIGYLFLT